MLDAVASVASFLTMVVTITMAAFLFFCVCGCRGKERKEELVGIEGHVKMRNPEVEPEVSNNSNGTTPAPEATTGAKRSLPDLPVDTVNWEANGDGASELYATVGKEPDKEAEPDKASLVRPEHPYDKVRKVENPYSQVVPSTSQEAAVVAANPPAAAAAIAGHVHASDDMPYMTPPPHFSGDSQDSAKGYTSISVREPLAEILAESRRTGAAPPGDYATLSDDSDDMYAAIEDPASGSETYAQITQPASVVPAAAPPMQCIQLQTLQESTSSGASSSTVNSPKPDKREAKSPLPAPPHELLAPPTLDDMYAKVNKKRRREMEDALQSTLRGHSTESGSSESVSYKLQSNASCTESNHSCHSHPTTESGSSSHTSRSHACCSSHSTTDSPSSRPQDDTDSSLSSDAETHGSYDRMDPPYETLSSKRRLHGLSSLDADPNYEELNSKPTQVDPGYETLGAHNLDPCYERLGGNGDISEPCYETLKSKSFSRSEVHGANIADDLPNGLTDPTYETLGRGSDSDPNYERIGVPHEDGYALVVKRKHDGYETVKFEPPYNSLGPVEPPYNSLIEPPYSSLGSVEPNYSSIHPLEPPYQRLADCESGSTEK